MYFSELSVRTTTDTDALGTTRSRQLDDSPLSLIPNLLLRGLRLPQEDYYPGSQVERVPFCVLHMLVYLIKFINFGWALPSIQGRLVRPGPLPTTLRHAASQKDKPGKLA
jgi:hypothetical protein